MYKRTSGYLARLCRHEGVFEALWCAIESLKLGIGLAQLPCCVCVAYCRCRYPMLECKHLRCVVVASAHRACIETFNNVYVGKQVGRCSFV